MPRLVRVSESGSPLLSSGTKQTPQSLQLMGRRSPPSPTRTTKHTKPDPGTRLMPVDEPVFAVEARPAVNSEAGDLIVVEPNSKLDHPTLKLEPGLAAEPDAKAEELPSERADILVQTLRGIRSNATGSAQNTKTIQCLMANFIVITTATDETKSVEQAKQVQMASLQVERACHAIVSTVDKIMGSTGPASDVCTQLARLSELCVGAQSRADVVESALEKMSERDLRLQVLQDKVWDVQIGLEKVTGKLGQL